jgi:hypothetical protein
VRRPWVARQVLRRLGLGRFFRQVWVVLLNSSESVADEDLWHTFQVNHGHRRFESKCNASDLRALVGAAHPHGGYLFGG